MISWPLCLLPVLYEDALQVFNEPKWKLEVVVQYLWKYIGKVSFHGAVIKLLCFKVSQPRYFCWYFPFFFPSFICVFIVLKCFLFLVLSVVCLLFPECV